MTGHLVLSTLHTNDASSAYTRLVDMEVEPFLVRSTVIGILAQRLVRVLCEACKEPYQATTHELAQLGLDPERTRKRMQLKPSPRYVLPGVEYERPGSKLRGIPTFYRARGCERCDNKGFSGRLGIYELLVAEDTVGKLVLANADAQSIKRAAVSAGMDTLRDDGARKVLLGRTTVEEVVAATQDDVLVDE
jgi:general secretion pathway protein E